jgi:hypothetical protein
MPTASPVNRIQVAVLDLLQALSHPAPTLPTSHLIEPRLKNRFKKSSLHRVNPTVVEIRKARIVPSVYRTRTDIW